VEDLARFFRQIVRNLTATDPARLKTPLPLGEIRHTILPYRANRRALQLESSEDYELALIRLCAGQGGYACTQPDEVGAEFAAETISSNPDLTIVLRHETALVILNQEQVARALGGPPEQAFAPPEHRFAPPALTEPPPALSHAQPGRQHTAICRACGGELPPGVNVKFCPHCGNSQEATHCPECETPIQPGWRHCVTCGTALAQ
jgi:hypothetical protein